MSILRPPVLETMDADGRVIQLSELYSSSHNGSEWKQVSDCLSKYFEFYKLIKSYLLYKIRYTKGRLQALSNPFPTDDIYRDACFNGDLLFYHFYLFAVEMKGSVII